MVELAGWDNVCQRRTFWHLVKGLLCLRRVESMMRVLIVDDEAPVRRLLQIWVEGEGATVLEAGSAEQALAVLESEGEVAVALCDLKLPGPRRSVAGRATAHLLSGNGCRHSDRGT